MALFLAGFRGVPEELREAARMDGASEWRVYRHVVFPHLRPVTLAALIILGHISIKVFDLIVAIGGKQIITEVPAVYMWVLIYDARDYAQGCGDRDAAARRDLGAHHPVPRLHGPPGAADMSTTTAAPPARRTGPGAFAPTSQRAARRRSSTRLLIVFAVIVLTPVYVLLVTSFKTLDEIDPSHAWSLPQTLDARRVARRRGTAALAERSQNSFKLAIPATILSCVLGSLNGFVLSKWRFPGADFVFTFFLFGMFIPYQAVMIPLIQLFDDVHFPGGHPAADLRPRGLRHPDHGA